MNVNDYQEKVKIAKESVKDLDGDLKVEAFKMVLSQLLEGGTKPADVPKKHRKARNPAKKQPSKEATPEIMENVSKIDIEGYSHIYKLSGIAIYLGIIKMVLDECKIDGLIPVDISILLKNKFRISKTYNTISMALGNAQGKYVDREQVGSGFKYKIMRPGIDFLEAQIAVILA